MTVSKIFSKFPEVLSRSSQSHLFLGSYANMHVYEEKKFTDPLEFTQNMCRWFLKDLKNSFNSFCSNLIKIIAFSLVLNQCCGSADLDPYWIRISHKELACQYKKLTCKKKSWFVNVKSNLSIKGLHCQYKKLTCKKKELTCQYKV